MPRSKKKQEAPQVVVEVVKEEAGAVEIPQNYTPIRQVGANAKGEPAPLHTVYELDEELPEVTDVVKRAVRKVLVNGPRTASVTVEQAASIAFEDYAQNKNQGGFTFVPVLRRNNNQEIVPMTSEEFLLFLRIHLAFLPGDESVLDGQNVNIKLIMPHGLYGICPQDDYEGQPGRLFDQDGRFAILSL